MINQESKLKNSKFSDYINQKWEFSKQELLDPYYTQYDGHPDEEVAVEFWRQTIYEYSYSVSFQFEANCKQLVKQFTIFDRIPCGLPSIMQVLYHRGILTTREQMLNGQFYYKPGLVSRVMSGIFSSFWQSNTQDVENFVVVEFIDRQAEQLLKWAQKTESNIFSEAYLKRQLRKTTKHSEEDILLLLNHLIKTERMIVEQICDDPEMKLCKLAPVTLSNSKCEPITVKERAKFALSTHLYKLDERIHDYEQKMLTSLDQTKAYVQQKNMAQAQISLRRKKQYEKQLQVLQNQKFTVEEQLIGIESAESTVSVYDTLSVASDANKQLLDQSLTEMKDFENSIKQAGQIKSQVDELSQFFARIDVNDDQDLLQELENMTADSQQDQQKLDSLKLDQQLAEFESKIQELEEEKQESIGKKVLLS